MAGDFMDPIEFDDMWNRTVGGLPLVVGKVKQGGNDLVVYGAAPTEHDLRRERCGYGTTEAEAVADLFKMMRV